MKLAFFATGLVASIVACPWFVAQEPGPASSGQKPGYTINNQEVPRVIDVTTPGALPQLPAGYTERTVYEYDFGNSGSNPFGQGQWLNPNAPSNAKESLAFAKAFRAYQSAADDSARSKWTAELRTSLEKQYDAFVEGQATQIAQLEERLKKLKTQLEKRRGAKERMVELKLQMVLSQAEGLGFPDNGTTNQAFIYDERRYYPNAVPALGAPAINAVSPLEPPSPVLPPVYAPPAAAPGDAAPAGGGGGEDQNQVD